jgi:hypothetical protein
MAPHPGRGSPSLQAPVAMGSTASDRLNFEANAKTLRRYLASVAPKQRGFKAWQSKPEGGMGNRSARMGARPFRPLKTQREPPLQSVCTVSNPLSMLCTFNWVEHLFKHDITRLRPPIEIIFAATGFLFLGKPHTYSVHIARLVAFTHDEQETTAPMRP